MARSEGHNYRLMRLEERNLCVEQKDPKPWTPRPASSKEADASHRRATQLAELVLSLVEGLKQGPPVHQSVHQEGQTAGVGWKEEASIINFSDALQL